MQYFLLTLLPMMCYCNIISIIDKKKKTVGPLGEICQLNYINVLSYSMRFYAIETDDWLSQNFWKRQIKCPQILCISSWVAPVTKFLHTRKNTQTGSYFLKIVKTYAGHFWRSINNWKSKIFTKEKKIFRRKWKQVYSIPLVNYVQINNSNVIFYCKNF